MPPDILQPDLFAPERGHLPLSPGATLLGGFAAPIAAGLLAALEAVVLEAGFRHMATPGGFTMSVAMTNCGTVGWVSDQTGYRYARCDPQSRKPWPAMPPIFADLAARAAEAAGFAGFAPDSCLINCYRPGARLTLHQDRNERDFAAPIVSVSLGLAARFLWGGATRAVRPRPVGLLHGDVVVWGGPARLAYHGVDILRDGRHDLTGAIRYNLTFRRAL